MTNTTATKSATADKTFNDGVNEIIQSRRPFAQLDELIKTWRIQAGDGMRVEYEGQLQSAAPQ